MFQSCYLSVLNHNLCSPTTWLWQLWTLRWKNSHLLKMTGFPSERCIQRQWLYCTGTFPNLYLARTGTVCAQGRVSLVKHCSGVDSTTFGSLANASANWAISAQILRVIATLYSRTRESVVQMWYSSRCHTEGDNMIS